MSEQSSQEPTMEEILASIRRIISEDDAPADAAAPPEPEPAPAPVAVAPPEPEPEEEDDALELTDKVDAIGDLEVYTPAPTMAAPVAEPVVVAAPPVVEPAPTISSLVGESAATAAASAFGQLSAAISMPSEGRNLEDIVREMLRPMLQQWLDANLPGIVQQAVDAEVERIARSRR